MISYGVHLCYALQEYPKSLYLLCTRKLWRSAAKRITHYANKIGASRPRNYALRKGLSHIQHISPPPKNRWIIVVLGFNFKYISIRGVLFCQRFSWWQKTWIVYTFDMRVPFVFSFLYWLRSLGESFAIPYKSDRQRVKIFMFVGRYLRTYV